MRFERTFSYKSFNSELTRHGNGLKQNIVRTKLTGKQVKKYAEEYKETEEFI
jgi:hypothetical protein